MKSLNQFMQEQLVIREDKNSYKYFPKTKKELQKLIKQRIKDEGPEANLNDIIVNCHHELGSDQTGQTDLILFGEF